MGAQTERLERLLEASYALHESLNLDELLGRILDVASKGVGADRGTVFLLNTEKGQLWSRVLQGDEMLEISLPVGQGLAGAVAQDGEPVCVVDAYDDVRFDRSWDERSGYRTRQVLCAPICDRTGRLVGVFQLLNKIEGDFGPDDIEFLASLSIHAALAIENAQLHTAMLEKERYDREVALAQSVQRQLQPESFDRTIGTLQIAGRNELCEDASGDYYDCVVDLDGGRVAVVIGDVSGHGLQAALVMAEARAFLRAYLQTTDSLADAVQRLNDSLVPDLSDGRFITLFCAVVDPATGAIEWTNAGHEAPLLRRASGEIVKLGATNPLVGVFEGLEYRTGAAVVLEPDDALLLYTDGVTEARVPGGELFGIERLTEVFGGASGDAAEILSSVRAAVRAWTEGAVLDDDVTLLAVTRNVTDN